MVKRKRVAIVVAVVAAVLLAVLGLNSEFLKRQGGATDWEQECCADPSLEIRPGEAINGERVPPYVFSYADLNNDGVLRGREVRRAYQRIRTERRTD